MDTTASALSETEQFRALLHNQYGNEDAKHRSLELLHANPCWDRLWCRVLLVALNDAVESVRRHAVNVIVEKFRTAPTVDERIAWLDQIFVSIFAKAQPTVQDAELFLAIEQWVRQNRHQVPYLFLRLIQEAQRAQTSSYDPTLADAVIGFYKRACLKAGSQDTGSEHRSTELLRWMYEERVLEVLLNPGISPHVLIATIEDLRHRELGVMRLDILACHINPIINSYDCPVIERALNNLEKWGSEFRARNLYELPDVLDVLRQYRRESGNGLPENLVNQIGMNLLLTGSLVQFLCKSATSRQYQGICRNILRVLQHFHAIREYSKQMCDFALNHYIPNDVYPQIINLLGGILTSLDEDKSGEDKRRQIIYDLRAIQADRAIRETLVALANRPDLPEGVPEAALRNLIATRPANLNEMLQQTLEAYAPNHPLIQMAMDSLANLHVVESFKIVRYFWVKASVLPSLPASPSEGWDGTETREEKTAVHLVDVLKSLGHNEAADVLLEAMRESATPEIARQSREALIKAGYSLLVRSFETERLITELVCQNDKISSEIITLEERRRKLKIELKEAEIQHRRSIGHMHRLVIEMGIMTAEIQAQLIDYDISIAEEDLMVDKMIRVANSFDHQLGDHLGNLGLGGEPLEAIAQLISGFEFQVNRLKQLIREDKTELNILSEGLHRYRSERPEPPNEQPIPEETERNDKDYEVELKIWDVEVVFRQEQLAQLTEFIGEFSSGVTGISDQLSRQKAAIQRLQHYEPSAIARTFEDAQRNIRQSIRNIGHLETEQQNMKTQAESSVDRLNQTMGVLQANAKNQGQRMLALNAQIAGASRDIQDLRTQKQHLTQRIEEEMKAYRNLAERAKIQNIQTDRIAREHSKFLALKRQLEDTARLEVEWTIHRLGEERFQDEYGSQFATIKDKLGNTLEDGPESREKEKI